MSKFSIPQLIRVAELYYYRKKSQKEISIMLNISPATVSRMIQEALDIGIVKVEIQEVTGDYKEIEKEIEKRYDLEKVVIIKNPRYKDDWHIKKLLGKATGELFYKVAETGDRVGIGAGETMLEMISSLSYDSSLLGIHLLPLMGGWGFTLLHRETNKLVISMASILQCDYSLLLAPAFVSTPEVKDVFLKEDQINQVVKLWEGLNMAVFSIGPEVEHSVYPTIANGQNNMIDKEQAVGDVVGKIIDREGNELEIPYNKKIISIPFTLLKKVPKRTGVGGGQYKYRSIKAALNGGLINYLVTDYNTGKSILEDGGGKI